MILAILGTLCSCFTSVVHRNVLVSRLGVGRDQFEALCSSRSECVCARVEERRFSRARHRQPRATGTIAGQRSESRPVHARARRVIGLFVALRACGRTRNAIDLTRVIASAVARLFFSLTLTLSSGPHRQTETYVLRMAHTHSAPPHFLPPARFAAVLR